MLSLAPLVTAVLRFRARACVVLACIAAMLFASSIASAQPAVQAQTRVWDFSFASALNTWLERDASARTHLGNHSGSVELTSDSPHAARGSTLRRMTRSLGSAGDDLLLKKAVNTKLPHAIDQGVARKVFADASEARAALTGLTDSINKAGTFPAGTLVDTARAGRFLVPIGNNGLAVYHLRKGGTAALKTVLIAR